MSSSGGSRSALDKKYIFSQIWDLVLIRSDFEILRSDTSFCENLYIHFLRNQIFSIAQAKCQARGFRFRRSALGPWEEIGPRVAAARRSRVEEAKVPLHQVPDNHHKQWDAATTTNARGHSYWRYWGWTDRAETDSSSTRWRCDVDAAATHRAPRAANRRCVFRWRQWQFRRRRRKGLEIYICSENVFKICFKVTKLVELILNRIIYYGTYLCIAELLSV